MRREERFPFLLSSYETNYFPNLQSPYSPFWHHADKETMPHSTEHSTFGPANFTLVQGLAIDKGCAGYPSNPQSHSVKNRFQSKSYAWT